jgi:hypothetical protein
VATCNSGGSPIIVLLVYVIYIIIQKCLAAISSPHSTSLFNLVLRTHPLIETCLHGQVLPIGAYLLFFFFGLIGANDTKKQNKENGQIQIRFRNKRASEMKGSKLLLES